MEEKQEQRRAAEWQAVFEKWMRIFAVQFTIEPMEKENIEAYKIGLGDLKSPVLLDRAFTRAIKHAPRMKPDGPPSRPDIELIREDYRIEYDLARPGYRIYDSEATLSKEERDKVADNVRAEMRKKFPAMFAGKP